MTHDEIKADLSLFVLGALTPDEMKAVERHLAEGCDECTAEIQSWRDVVGLLPLGVESAAPARLRAELMQRVRSAPSTAPTVEARTKRAKVVPLRRWIVPRGLAAAAAVALAVGIVRDADMRARLREEQNIVAELEAAVELASTGAARSADELARVRQVLVAREGDVASLRAALAAAHESLGVLQRPGLSLVRLKQTPDAKPAEGHVLISPTGKALFYAFDLAPLPPDKVYELWWITEGEGPVNAGLFQPDAAGLGRIETDVPTAAGAIKAAAVTVEPAGGVAKPTGPMVLLGNV